VGMKPKPDILTARDILAEFIAGLDGGGPRAEPALAAILLEHLLLQGGYKIVPRIPDETMGIAGGRPGGTPSETWTAMWDAAGTGDLDQEAEYVPA
jgi:hypothetical protein